MWGRLLTKAAVLLAAVMGPVGMANEPGTETENLSKITEPSVAATSSAGQLAKPDSSTKPNGDAPRSPRVLLITSKESEACRREVEKLSKAGGVFAAMQSQGWKIGVGSDNHVQLVDEKDVPELVKQLDSSEFPIVACVSDGEIVRSFKDGCSTPLDAWTFGWLLKGVSERPQGAIPEAIRVASTGSYPLRGNHWTVDGDTNPTKATLVGHLRSATHVQYLDVNWKIEDWSTEELRSLHDDLHEKYGPAAPAAFAAAGARSGPPDGIRKGLGK